MRVAARGELHCSCFHRFADSKSCTLIRILICFEPNLGPSHLASFGAFISILAMAIDPFSQQIIQVYTHRDLNNVMSNLLTVVLQLLSCFPQSGGNNATNQQLHG